MKENSEELEFRPLRYEDIDRVVEIENECFSEPWSRNAFEESVDSKFNRIYCLKKADVLLGFVGWAWSFDEAEINNVAIDEAYRGNGYGSIMLENAIEYLAEFRIKTIYLEVRAWNKPAISLYSKFGFEKIGIRKNFYRFPTEDAVVMKKVLSEKTYD